MWRCLLDSRIVKHEKHVIFLPESRKCLSIFYCHPKEVCIKINQSNSFHRTHKVHLPSGINPLMLFTVILSSNSLCLDEMCKTSRRD